MAILDLATGLRCSELFALKWCDVIWNDLVLLVRRAIVDGVVNDVKTKYSRAGMPLDPELQEALSAPPLVQYDISMSLEAQPLDDSKTAPEVIARPHDGFNVKTASLFFGNSSLGGSLSNIERWQPGEEPTIVLPDPDMKAIASLPLPSE